MAEFNPENPLIVQGDHTVLLEVDSPRYLGARDALARFAELIKSPEHIHTYRITPLSIWNACAAGVEAAEIVDTLHEFSKYDVPQHVAVEIRDYASRYGRLRLSRDSRVQRLEQGREAGDRGHVQYHDLPAPQGRRICSPRVVRSTELGADYLRRGPSVAGAGVPGHGWLAGHATIGTDRHAGP